MRTTLFLTASLSVLIGGCETAPPREAEQGSDAAPVSERAAPIPGLQGTWDWVQSTGGSMGDTITPASSGRSYRLEILPGGRYRETSSVDGVSESRFVATTGYTFNEPGLILPVLRFQGRPLFAGWFVSADQQAVVIRGDTLELRETHSHPWNHLYLRAPESRS